MAAANANAILVAGNEPDLRTLEVCKNKWERLSASIPHLDRVRDRLGNSIGVLVVKEFFKYEKQLEKVTDLKEKVAIQKGQIQELRYSIDRAKVWHVNDEKKMRAMRTTIKVMTEDMQKGGQRRPLVINNDQDKKKQKGSIDPFLVPMDMNVSSLTQASAQALVPAAAPAPQPAHCRQRKDKVKTEKESKKGTAAASGGKA